MTPLIVDQGNGNYLSFAIQEAHPKSKVADPEDPKLIAWKAEVENREHVVAAKYDFVTSALDKIAKVADLNPQEYSCLKQELLS